MAQPTRVALVTGGIGGIGTAICERLAKEGYQVVANCHPSETEAASLARRPGCRGPGDRHWPRTWPPSRTARAWSARSRAMGPVSVLINCAGITRDKTFRKMEPAQWEAVINVNLNSVFNVTRGVWEGMLEQGYGRIVNISSVNGQRGQFGQANYSAAKAGMHGVTMALAQEGAAKGVTVNTVSPGYVETAMTLAMDDTCARPSSPASPCAAWPPAEIAAAVAFLARTRRATSPGSTSRSTAGCSCTERGSRASYCRPWISLIGAAGRRCDDRRCLPDLPQEGPPIPPRPPLTWPGDFRGSVRRSRRKQVLLVSLNH